MHGEMIRMIYVLIRHLKSADGWGSGGVLGAWGGKRWGRGRTRGVRKEGQGGIYMRRARVLTQTGGGIYWYPLSLSGLHTTTNFQTTYR